MADELLDSVFPWVPSFTRRLPASPEGTLAGDTLYIASDYSGEDSRSPYDVLSFLLVSPADTTAWQILRTGVRKAHLGDGRRMAFKNLKDRVRAAAAPAFLGAARTLPGLCVTIAINKRITDLSHGPLLLERPDGLTLRHGWTPKAIERMARTAHFVALLIAKYSSPGQNVYWMSDEDQLFANLAMSKDLVDVLGMWSGLYVAHDLGEAGVGTTAMDPGDRFEEDLAAIPDLVAGATREFLMAVSKTTGGILPSGLAVPEPEGLSDRTHMILDWLTQSAALTHAALLFETRREGGYALSNFSVR